MLLSNKIQCLIIDDDPFIRDLLKDKLNQYVPEVEVLDTVSSGSAGLEKIVAHQPDLVFLDVEMGDMTGFEMLNKLPDINFQTIFITSYNHYAIKAIRYNALDYLLKPFDLGDLKRAVSRYKTKQKLNVSRRSLEHPEIVKTKKVAGQLLTLQTQEGELRLGLKNILRIEGDRNYSCIHLENHKKKLASRNLRDLQEVLRGKGFFRCHKSHLVNFDHIKKHEKRFAITLSDDTEIPVSRRRKEEFDRWIASYHKQLQ